MNNLKNQLVIGGAIVFFVLSGLAWNYTGAMKEKNEIARLKVISNQEEADLDDEFKQREKCLKLKQDYQESKPLLEGFSGQIVKEEVVYNKNENNCFLFEREVWFAEGGVTEHESIIDLLKGSPVIWYPSAGQWTLEEFQIEKERLGF